jgi:nucleoside-diphosphate-sugar epimerase
MIFRRCLITGGNGFIGSALIKRILSISNIPSFWLVRYSVRFKIYDPNFPDSESVAIGNINHKTDWGPALKDVDTVVHTAAIAHIMGSNSTNLLHELNAVNVLGTENLAVQCVLAKIKRFIFISSIGVNGNQTLGIPFNENSICDPQDFYSLSKWNAENTLKTIFKNSGVDLIIVRPPLVYGRNSPGNFRRLYRLIKFRIPLPFGAVNNKRSYISIDNLSDFIVTLINYPHNGSGLFLISDGVELSTKDLIRKIGSALGRTTILLPVPVPILFFLSSLIGKQIFFNKVCRDLQIDISKAKKIIGWSPYNSVDDSFNKAFSNARPNGSP